VKTFGEWRYSDIILVLGVNEGQWSASSSGRKEPSVPFLIGVWVGLRSGSDVVEKREISYPYMVSNASRPARGYTDWAVSVLYT
jgi:hypothetical protein